MRWKYREGGLKAIFLILLSAAAALVFLCPAGGLVRRVYGQLLPAASFCMDTLAYGDKKIGAKGRLMDMIARELPLYSYSISYFGEGMMNQYYKEYVEILMQEANEEPKEDLPDMPEGIQKENNALEEGNGSGQDGASKEEQNRIMEDDMTIEAENEEAGQRLNEEGSYFTITDGNINATDKNIYKKLIHSEKAQEVSLESYQEFEALTEKFYTVDSNTYVTAAELAAKNLAAENLKVKKDGAGPQILIYHTHSQEGYADSIAGDVSTTIVGAGEQLAEILQKEYGYQVLHHTERYDENRDYAYSYALPALEKVLLENPTIEVLIDLHRDSVAEDTKLVTKIEGYQTAKFMFFNGLSRVRELGEIGYLPNENLQSNLAFSFQMQKACEEYYPGLTRKIYLKGYRYNMHLKPRTLLVELGAQNNTLQEALNACGPLARMLDVVLGGE